MAAFSSGTRPSSVTYTPPVRAAMVLNRRNRDCHTRQRRRQSGHGIRASRLSVDDLSAIGSLDLRETTRLLTRRVVHFATELVERKVPTHTVFYSWQFDLPNTVHQGLIGDCIQRALKELRGDEVSKLDLCLDRDTSGKRK